MLSRGTISYVVSSLLIQKIREGKMSTVLHALHNPGANDRFTEIVHGKGFIRVYFNDYQLGFNFLIAPLIRLKDKATYRPAMFDDRNPGLLNFFRPPETKELPKDVYRLQSVTVEKVSALTPQDLGCEVGGMEQHFPGVKDHHFCLLMRLSR